MDQDISIAIHMAQLNIQNCIY